MYDCTNIGSPLLYLYFLVALVVLQVHYNPNNPNYMVLKQVNN